METNSNSTLEQLETVLQKAMPHCVVIASGERTTLVRTRAAGYCDFCLDTLDEKAREFKSKSVEVQVGDLFSWYSDSIWTACPSCAAYILREDWGGLLAHTKRRYVRRFREMPDRDIEEYIKFPQLVFKHVYIREVTDERD